MKIVGRLRFVGAAILAGVVLAGCPGSGGIVTFNDSNLELAVRSQLRQPFGFISVSDMLELQVLDARSFGITDLDGLQTAVNLQTLILNDNSVADIRELSNLPVLQDVQLANNPVFDLTPLQGALSLRSLRLCGTDVRSLTPLVINSVNGGLGPNDRIVIDEEIRNADPGNVSELEAGGVDIVDCDGMGNDGGEDDNGDGAA